jgi:hypothetical protein
MSGWWANIELELGNDELGSAEAGTAHIAPGTVELFETLGLEEPSPILVLAVE